MAKKILIVDDIAINRAVLKAAIGDEYDTLDAANGEEALTLLSREYKTLSAVLLDIDMPVMNGYEVLRRRSENPLLSQIPTIVVTGSEDESTRVKALALGANDFMVKPYNPDIIRHCLRNNIALREIASIVNAIQKDKLTGVYNREFFFAKVDELIGSHAPGTYLMLSLDIDSFKLINDRYGTPEGDRILKHIGASLQKSADEENGICGRITGDHFAALFYNQPDVITRLTGIHFDRIADCDTPAKLRFSAGCCIVKDCELPASVLYDRASIAQQSVKGRYDRRFAFFDDAMLAQFVKEQQIVNDMNAAISQRQLEIWLQPQYNHATEALIGAEALVRWRHPKNGLMMPGSFIPVFEQNGFVYEVDKYVWAETCRLLRKWLDEGKEPLPISVNISRCDILREDLVAVLTGLLAEYRLPADLLRLEITESAFEHSAEQIVSVVQELVDHGFTVEIDDFGSAYSSLNILKDVPAQILKLDMRFLENSHNSQRGGSILESIVRMAKWLGMRVIAEGVETVQQANYLKSIGCLYIQGYLYARPMPVAEYETLAFSSQPQHRLPAMDTLMNLDSNRFWDPASIETLIFSSFVCGACIFEEHNGSLEMLRASDNFFEGLGDGSMTMDAARKLDWVAHLDEPSAAALQQNLAKSIKTKEEFTVELCFLDLPSCSHETHLRSTMRVIASVDDRALIYSSNENVTQLWQAEERNSRYARQLKILADCIPGGLATFQIQNGKASFVYMNEGFYRSSGFTREEYEQMVAHDPFAWIAEEDRPAAAAAVAQLLSGDGTSVMGSYRCRGKDGSYRYFSLTGVISEKKGDIFTVHAMKYDITDLITAQEPV